MNNAQGSDVITYKHILVAVDFSPISERVLKRAYEIARESQALLSIVHVLEYSPVAYGGEFSVPVDMNLTEILEDSARDELAKLAERYNIASEHQYLETGSVKLAIVRLAKTLHTDLMVIGSHSHHGLEVLLGSHASGILHHAHCDVLVIRNDEENKNE